MKGIRFRTFFCTNRSNHKLRSIIQLLYYLGYTLVSYLWLEIPRYVIVTNLERVKREEIQIEKCGLFRMAWQSCMEVHWQKYYPIAATRKQRSQKDKN